MRHLVIGLGEVGTALQKILDCNGYTHGSPETDRQYDILHICYPYSETFEISVRTYRAKFGAQFAVIHSTVPVGTSRRLGVAHSPIRGMHPDLEESIRTFTKYVGGKNAGIIAESLKEYGIPAVAIESSDETEAGKLFDLMQYGVSILLNKEIWKYCKDNFLNFETVYTQFNHTYNQGYTLLGRDEVIRPNLTYMPGKIGGHCVTQMMELLESPSAKFILEENKKL